jgi:hypothetical protein
MFRRLFGIKPYSKGSKDISPNTKLRLWQAASEPPAKHDNNADVQSASPESSIKSDNRSHKPSASKKKRGGRSKKTQKTRVTRNRRLAKFQLGGEDDRFNEKIESLIICQQRSRKVSYTYKLDETSDIEQQHVDRVLLILYDTKLVGTAPFRRPVQFVSGVEFKPSKPNTKNLTMYKPSFCKTSEEKKQSIAFWNTFTLLKDCPPNQEGWDPKYTNLYSYDR